MSDEIKELMSKIQEIRAALLEFASAKSLTDDEVITFGVADTPDFSYGGEPHLRSFKRVL